MKYDLGVPNKYNEPPLEPMKQGDEPTKHYPTLFVEGVEMDLPEEGTAVVKYRLTRETEDYKRKKCNYDIEILSFEPKGVKVTKKVDTGEILDKIMEEITSEEGDSEEE